jgi:UDP-N-acetylglucosamine--N-acetylmuramyl-(pentapeptide) pyrophosphoryl-undecaprenol N-acetylglucosamine transferase
MKIVFTGGGTGGHFYPIIAIAEQVNKVADEQKIIECRLYFFSNSPYDKNALFENNIEYHYVPAGKLRLYFSLQNIVDFFSLGFGFFVALVKLFFVYPDIVVGKGGGSSFPTLLAAKVLGIPIMIHESDTVPGRVNKFLGKYATRIAVSYPEAASFFPKNNVAWTGQPIRKDLHDATESGAFEYLKLEPGIPVILFLGGSQGAQKINDVLIDALPELIKKYQIIHQTGAKNLEESKSRASIVIGSTQFSHRYKPFAFLNVLASKMAAGAASLIVSRAGSTLFEIALYGKPSIIIPITESNGDHQRKNAYAYARSGGAVVIEEANLTPNLLFSEIDSLLSNPLKLEKMASAAKSYGKPDAAYTIAKEIITIAIAHES